MQRRSDCISPRYDTYKGQIYRGYVCLLDIRIPFFGWMILSVSQQIKESKLLRVPVFFVSKRYFKDL